MRTTIKKWGNGLAVRLPRSSPETGRLEEGMEVEVQVRALKRVKNWKPVTFRSPIPDLSVRHDEIREERFQERWGYLVKKVKGSPS